MISSFGTFPLDSLIFSITASVVLIGLLVMALSLLNKARWTALYTLNMGHCQSIYTKYMKPLIETSYGMVRWVLVGSKTIILKAVYHRTSFSLFPGCTGFNRSYDFFRDPGFVFCAGIGCACCSPSGAGVGCAGAITGGGCSNSSRGRCIRGIP